jgi:acyl carrier protein
MTMTRDEVFTKVRGILVDALAVEEEDVQPSSVLTKDLGAESIDFLDIVFKLEQAFGIKIPQGELFPDNVAQNPEFVKDGKVTPRGIEMLRERMPHLDLSTWERDPQVGKVQDLFTVDTLVKFVEAKLASKG